MDSPVLTSDQRDILAALDSPGTTHLHDRPAGALPAFMPVALGVAGVLSLLAGAGLILFLPPVGFAVLALGALCCAVAFV